MIGGVTRKVHFLVVALPHSDAIFVKAYPAETAEAFGVSFCTQALDASTWYW